MNVLITGIAGLMGSRLAKYIIENTNHTVFGIDNLSGGFVENIPKESKFYNFDLLDHKKINDFFEKNKIDIVYHLAAYAAEGLSPFIRRFNYQNNLISSVNLINAAVNYDVKRFVFTSSMAVYGDNPSVPFSEDLIPTPIDPYGVAKFSVEQDLRIAYHQHGLDYTIIRPHNFYGVNQNIWDKYRNVLGIWMRQILDGDQMTIYGDGEQTRAFSFIDDSLEPMWLASQKKEAINQIINLGGTKDISINQACETLIEVTGTKIKPIYLEQRHEVKHAYASWEKSVDILGFENKTTLKSGLEKMWNWAKNQNSKNVKTWKNYEIEKGIYDYWKNKKK
jgi:UDP-glucose 4-epimerase